MSETILPVRPKGMRNHIKNTFLSMLKKKPFPKIRITTLCETAGIARATFYAYYQDIYDLVDDIMDDALVFLDSITDRTCHETFEDLWDVVRQNDLAVFKAYNNRLPPCYRLIDIPKYHPLVQDDTIVTLMMKKIFMMEKGHFIAYMAEKQGVSAYTSENIFWSIINGSMAVNKKIGWCKNDEWYGLQLQLLRFTMYGLEGLGNTGNRLHPRSDNQLNEK
ncbi:TetR/AcrR family transcriptional regulator [Dialister sp.]|uniref:TetR/AcrR family transcriptional regulator n=1 Tax=Dialister sp. TaxID=1955814 RepID=UPI003F007287